MNATVHGRPDRGAADALGLVILAVPMFAFALLVFYVGRNVDIRAQFRAAAESAAQAAALERNPVDAQRAAEGAFAAMVGADRCQEPEVDVVYPASQFGVSADLVEVTVRCRVSNEGFELLGPATGAEQRVSVRAVAGLDYFRAGGE